LDVREPLKTVAPQVDKFLGACPNDMSREFRHQDLKIIWTGLILENIFTHEAETPAIAKFAGTAHSSVFHWKQQWYNIDWRTRHGWLILFDGFRRSGAPVREGLADIHGFIRENFGGSSD
jgi:hypothetical protein